MANRILLFLTLALTACSQALPAGFWEKYKTDLLVKNINDQGPRGGYKALYWKADKLHPFSKTVVLDFATRNGWTLTDSVAFSQAQTSKWSYNTRAIFPLTNTGFTVSLPNNASSGHFPRWFGGPLHVYKFKTGWVLIEPGTDNSTGENGFIVLDHNGTQMAVYHLWGE